MSRASHGTTNRPLVVLAVDDEAPALDELVYLLREHPDIAEVLQAADATSALRELNGRSIDAVFLDVNMPGLSGLELAGVLANYSYRPAVVFVTAHDDKAVEAFDVGAVDYLLKPIRQSRLDEAIRRVLVAPVEHAREEAVAASDDETKTPTSSPPSSAASPSWCHGTPSVGWRPRATMRDCIPSPARIWCGYRWALSNPVGRSEGSRRIHRSYLVALRFVVGVRTTDGAVLVRLRANGASPAVELPVSRRQARELRDRVIREPMRHLRPADPGSDR